MAPTIASTVVDRPAAQVFAYATNPARFREWQQGVIDGPIRATVDVTVELLTETSSRLTVAGRLRRARHRQAARPAHRPPPGTQGDASQAARLAEVTRVEMSRPVRGGRDREVSRCASPVPGPARRGPA
jgi:hypothetical protein